MMVDSYMPQKVNGFYPVFSGFQLNSWTTANVCGIPRFMRQRPVSRVEGFASKVYGLYFLLCQTVHLETLLEGPYNGPENPILIIKAAILSMLV